jgi:hypothetical protein
MAVVSLLDRLKAEAVVLEAEARASGKPIKHSAALEQVAKRAGYAGWRACHAALSTAQPKERRTNPVEMKRYRSGEWNFSLDIPTRWNAFPAVPANSPFEVVRFASREDGFHSLVVIRHPYDPKVSPEEYSKFVQDYRERGGFSNFVSGKETFGSRTVVTLEFDKPGAAMGHNMIDSADTWSQRSYFLIDGSTLAYTLGFGTTRLADMRDLFDRMAESFTAEQRSEQ